MARRGTPVVVSRCRRHRRRRRTSRRTLLATFAAAVVGVAGAAVTLSLTTTAAVLSSCSLSALRPIRSGSTSFVYAANGSLLGAIPAPRAREPVPLAEMSPWLPRATVAIEDRRFWQHGALDYVGIARAALEDIAAGRVVEGGSTITQQLVRNLYLGDERSLGRKLEEACLAVKLARVWPKERILQTYLNQVYYGDRAYGVEAAAETYFSRPAETLGLAQAALVAGLAQAPSAYDPVTRPGAARIRRNQVLAAMLESGDITRRQERRALRKPLGLHLGHLYTRIREQAFFDYVVDRLVGTYGAASVRRGGLRVYTTIEPHLQLAAEQAIRDTLPLTTDPAGALVAIDPRTGAIRAMASVVPQARGAQFNLAVQARRQAGSAFKTFVLTDAIERGIDPDTTRYLSAPFTWTSTIGGGTWNVKTDDGRYYGSSTLTDATLRSDNTVYARLTLDLGPESVAQTARRMGIRSPLQPVPSIGLGTNGVSPLEMASGYATLAAGGIYAKPYAIREVIRPSGRVDTRGAWSEQAPERVVPYGVAYDVTRVLEQNILRGTGTGANIGRPAAGKTGTTSFFTDAWFCGYTPALAAAVWVGYPNASIPMTDVHGIEVFGGTFPATIWRLFMQQALSTTPATDWAPPLHPPVLQAYQGAHAFVSSAAGR